MKRIWILIGVLGFCTPFWAQNLDQMNETERKTALLRIAKAGVLEFGPDFYREYGEPEIAHGYVESDKYFTDDQLEKYRNRSYYTVKYFYNKNEEDFMGDFSAWVYIWGDTGKVFKIFFGGNSGWGNLDDPQATEGLKQAEWTKRPPGSLRSHRAIRVEEVPPLSDGNMRRAALKGLLSDSEMKEAKRRGILSESEIQEIETRYLPQGRAKKSEEIKKTE